MRAFPSVYIPYDPTELCELLKGRFLFQYLQALQFKNLCSWLCLKTLFNVSERFDVYENQYYRFSYHHHTHLQNPSDGNTWPASQQKL